MTNIKDVIGSIEVLQQASPASLASLVPMAALKRISKGEHLFWDKEKVRHLYFVVDGRFSLYKLDNLGEKKVVFVYDKGKMLNEVMIQGYAASINCEALTDSRALVFPKEAFIEVMKEDFALSKAVMDSMAMKIRRLYRQLKNTTGTIRVDKKIAAKLWKLSKDHGIPCEKGTRIDLGLTITYLAEMLGAKRETVSRHIKPLIDAGLILQQKNNFVIPDRDKLKDYFKHV